MADFSLLKIGGVYGDHAVSEDSMEISVDFDAPDGSGGISYSATVQSYDCTADGIADLIGSALQEFYTVSGSKLIVKWDIASAHSRFTATMPSEPTWICTLFQIEISSGISAFSSELGKLIGWPYGDSVYISTDNNISDNGTNYGEILMSRNAPCRLIIQTDDIEGIGSSVKNYEINDQDGDIIEDGTTFNPVVPEENIAPAYEITSTYYPREDINGIRDYKFSLGSDSDLAIIPVDKQYDDIVNNKVQQIFKSGYLTKMDSGVNRQSVVSYIAEKGTWGLSDVSHFFWDHLILSQEDLDDF